MAIPQQVVDLFLKELAAHGLPAPEYGADGSFTLKVNDCTITANLDNIARDFQRDGDEGRIGRFVATLAATSSRQLPAWNKAARGLRFSAESSNFDFGDALYDTVTDSLCRALVWTDADETQIVYLTPSLIAPWEQSVERLQEIAARNMADLLTDVEIEVADGVSGRIGMFRTRSPFKASFVFCSNLRACVEPQLGWPVFLLVPCRDFAYVIPEDQHELIPSLALVVVREFHRSGYPVSTEVFLASDEGLMAIAEFRDRDEVERDAADDAPDGLKTIVYRGGLVSFRLPDWWEEEYDEKGGATFYEDEADSGTLRLDVLTLEVKKGVVADTATELLKRRSKETGGTIEPLANGNAILSYRQARKQGDEELIDYHWEITNPVPPRHCRYAIFTYTVPAYRAESAEVLAEVALLQHTLEACQFAAELGE